VNWIPDGYWPGCLLPKREQKISKKNSDNGHAQHTHIQYIFPVPTTRPFYFQKDKKVFSNKLYLGSAVDCLAIQPPLPSLIAMKHYLTYSLPISHIY
jgi:hypothetical protein